MTNKPGHIVVGVDGSPGSLGALTWAVGQAALTGADVHAVIAWQRPTAYDGFIANDGVDWAVNARQAIDTALDTALGKGRERVSSSVVEGHPARVLLDAAADAELLVVGNRGHGGFVGMLLGSVSEQVITHATCPVLVLRHADHR